MKKQNLKYPRPWRGDLLASVYDWIMVQSVFPRKFRADYREHCRIIEKRLADIHGMDILEIGTGSGFTAPFIATDNRYTGSDISPGLLKRAEKKFAHRGFVPGKDAEFHRAAAESLPFGDNRFDYGICLLTLNFIGETEKALKELYRVMRIDSTILFCVPSPERLGDGIRISGQLYTAKELENLFGRSGFVFKVLPEENGALLYFEVQKH